MAALNLFLPYVLPHVPGCPDLAAQAEVLRAAIEFCRKSRAWKAWLDPLDVAANQAAYPLAAPANAAIRWIEEARIGDTRLDPMTRESALATYGDAWDSSYRGEPSGYLLDSLSELVLVPIPEASVTGALRVQAALEPAQAAAALPDFLAEQYREAIAHGALARLLAVPGRAWGNPPLAAYHEQQFGTAIGGAAARASAGFTRRAVKTKARYR